MLSRTFEDLEKRCKKINRKRYLIWFFILFLLFAIFGAMYFEFFASKSMLIQKDIKHTKTNIVKKSKNIVKLEKKKEKSKKISQKSSLAKKVVKKHKSKIELKKDKKAIEKKSVKYNTIFLNPNIVTPKTKSKNKHIKKSTPKKIKTLKNDVRIKKKKILIKVKSFKEQESLLRDNGINEDFETTLKLSNYYLDKLNYKKAIYWSKKASTYKQSSFRPWFVYAKAKIKQHKKSEAIRAIRTFLSYYDSSDARKFLIKIEGK